MRCILPTFSKIALRRFPRLHTGAACAALILLATVTCAQKSDQPIVDKLIDQRPFDEIVLIEPKGKVARKVLPLEFPDRQVPSPFPGGKLQVRLLDRPAQVFEVQWKDIAEIRLYEAMLLAEAIKLTNESKYNEAFDYYSRLKESYPQMEGLDAAVERYLQQDALAAYKAGEYDRALAVLQSLFEQNPQFDGLAKALDGVGNKIIENQLAASNFSAARNTLELLSRQFPGLKLGSIPQWRQRFIDKAAQKVGEAQKLVAAQNYANARRTIRQALSIWPEDKNAVQLLASIDVAYPMMLVGVMESAPSDLTPRLDSWPSLRCSRLTQRTLAELVDYGSEGGIYSSPLGAFSQDAAGTTLTLQIDRQRLTDDAVGGVAAAVARLLLQTAEDPSPPYSVELAQRLDAVRLEFPDKVLLEFATRHIRPEALLQLPLSNDLEQQLATNLFREATRDQATVRFEMVPGRNAANSSAVRSVEEVTFPNDDAAIAALIRGEVDILDRVPPWQVAGLQSQSSVQVGTYRLPTVHVLIPNPRVPLVNKREFRRALVYGIDRDRIVKDILLGGKELPGFQTISGPFPAGASQSDPVRYAYNNQIKPHAYDPRLAAVLAMGAWKSLNKPAEPPKEVDPDAEPPKPPPIPKLRLAHSADPVARTACQTIKLQLEAINIPIELVELKPDTKDDSYDLRYAELAVWEPLVDANRVLGLNGVAGTATDYMIGALAKLDSATTWNQVQAALYEIHALAHSDLPVIPLWQTVNYFAYRRDFQGMVESPVVLYQNVSEWQRVSGTAQVR